MKLVCNIDRRGRIARAIWGMSFFLIGVVVLVADQPAGWLAWAIGLVCLGMGAFSLFEASVGWCVVRALGWKTPM